MTVAMSGSKPNDDAPLLEEPLSPEEVRAYEERLSSLLHALEHEVDRVEADFLRPSGGERAQPEDESIEENALDVELGALAVEDELGYEVSEALDRISEGTFGLCGTCGEWIDRARLQLLPYARLCIGCARKAE